MVQFETVKRYLRDTYANLTREYRRDRAKFALRVTVVLLSVAILLLKRSIWTPDTLLLIVIILGVSFGRTRQFIVRFVPFLGLLVVYDSLRGLADDINTRVNYWPMIHVDTWLTSGVLPTVWLQSILWHGVVSWYDFYFYFLYTIHFVTPVVVGMILWRLRPHLYWPFVWSIVGVSFAAFVTYIIFPAAPPWLAKELGYITDPLTRISSDIWLAMGVENFSELYKNISPNAVAAVPSLHSAYPLIAAAFIIKGFGWRRMWWMVLYPVSMWLGVVYLGEHYVFDIFAAIVYVGLTILAVRFGFRRYRSRHRVHWWHRIPFIATHMV